MRIIIHQFSGNKDTENRNRSNNKEYGQPQRSNIGSKYKPPLKKKYLQTSNETDGDVPSMEIKNTHYHFHIMNSNLKCLRYFNARQK